MINVLSWQFLIVLIAVSVRRSHQTSCPYPVPPKHAVLSAQSYLDEFNFNGFQAYQRVDFICRVGYRKTKGAMWSICGVSGRWYPDTRQAGECTRELRTGEIECKGRFRCRKDLQCIDRRLRCDCKPDCRDGTDEIGCKNPKKFIFMNPAVRKTSGVLTSPNYPLGYAKSDFHCHFIFYTDPAYRVKLSFEDFALRGKVGGKCEDYVKMSGFSEAYLSKFRTTSNIESDARLSATHCGDRSFDVIISNNSQLDMFVRLSGVKVTTSESKLRGYSLAWKVITQSEADEITRTIRKNAKEQSNGSNSESKMDRKVDESGLLTILLPVAISVSLPVSLVFFLCYHMRGKQARSPKQRDTTHSETVSDQNSVVAKLVDVTKNEESNLPLMAPNKGNSDPQGYSTMRRSEMLEGKESWEDLVQCSPPEGLWTASLPRAASVARQDDTVKSIDLDLRNASGRFVKNHAVNEESHGRNWRNSNRLSTTSCAENFSGGDFHEKTCSGMIARIYDVRNDVDNTRKYLSLGRSYEEKVATAGYDRSMAIAGSSACVSGLKESKCFGESPKYLNRSLRPLAKVKDEDTGNNANRKSLVCSCNYCENKVNKIKADAPLTCEPDTWDKIHADVKVSPPQIDTRPEGVSKNLDLFKGCADDCVSCTGANKRCHGSRTSSGKRRRRHGRRNRTLERTRSESHRVLDERTGAVMTVDNCHLVGCNVCENFAGFPRGGTAELLTNATKFATGSNRSTSSDSGTYTGSEAPTKWLPPNSASALSVHSRLKYRSDYDSGSRASSNAESFEDRAANFGLYEQPIPLNGAEFPLGYSYEEFAPTDYNSYGYHGNQDGGLAGDDMYNNLAYMGSERSFTPNFPLSMDSMPANQRYFKPIDVRAERDEAVVHEETISNSDNRKFGITREEFFQNGRRSDESVVFSDNKNVNDSRLSMPSYADDCECRACTNSRITKPFVFVMSN